jgi:Fe-S cluster biosynthesis and repair protein YggX
VVGDTFGQTEITNAGEVLRTLWEEVGEKTFVEWIRRADVLVSEKTLLLCGLREQGTWRGKTERTCTYAKGKQTPCEDCNAGCPVRYLWESGVYGSTPHRQESDEQRSAELGALVQELSRQTAPREVFLRCLRRSSERSSSMQQALASLEKE